MKKKRREIILVRNLLFPWYGCKRMSKGGMDERTYSIANNNFDSRLS